MTGNLETPTKLPPPKASRTRRSARVLEHDPIVAPGFGTNKDLQRLSQQLSQSGPHFSVEAVTELMRSRGRGANATSDDTAAAEAPASNAWANFMEEEGVGDLLPTGTAAAASVPAPAAASSSATSASKKEEASPDEKRSYELAKTSSSKKRSKKEGGALLQTGTLECQIVGRSKAKSTDAPYHLTVPTRILDKIMISKVFTSGNAVHSVAVDVSGNAYGWGRNEAHQLGSNLPANIILPTRLEFSSPLQQAAMGKSHTVFLLQDDTVWAVGANKVGQCGVKTTTDVPNFRKCPVPDDVTIVQIACGEDFTVALSSEGRIYTTGSSEYGQMANGETGEYFVAANKLAFANCNVLTVRTTFCHAPNEKLHMNNETCKVVPISEDIRIQAIACGKHHAIAVEAASSTQPRVFSWGCGNYGCLGHGVQADEYFPRNVGSLHNAQLGGDVRVTAGATCSLLQTSNGHVYYWGKHRSVGEAMMRPQLVEALANNQHVVTHCAAGAQTVFCTTSMAQTVSWGQGPHGKENESLFYSFALNLTLFLCLRR
jgi:alpha-tubulin suppressor-like RCC1 family protein